MMNGYLLLALELAAILLVCVLLAFLAGRVLGRRAGRSAKAQPVTAASPSPAGPGPKPPVLPELYEPPARPRTPGLAEPSAAASTLPPSLEQTRPVAQQHQPDEVNDETVTRASLQEEKPAEAPAAGQSESAAEARIKELEEKLRKQEIEMSRLETGATTAWDTTMPQLLGRIESLEQELRQAHDEAHQLQNLLEIERGRTVEEGWPSTPAE